VSIGHKRQEDGMKTGTKEKTKEKGTLRPWLVDVAIDHLR
jgi:hypothetical protein